MRLTWVHLFTLFVIVSLIILGADNEVNAAPEPCGFWDHHHYHYQETTPIPVTTQPPEETKKEEEKDKSDKKEQRKAGFKRLEKMLSDWLSWGQTLELQQPRNGNYIDSFIKGYLEILAYLFNIL